MEREKEREGERGRERRGTATQNAELKKKKKKKAVTTKIGNQRLDFCWFSWDDVPELNISYEARMPDIGISRSSCR